MFHCSCQNRIQNFFFLPLPSYHFELTHLPIIFPLPLLPVPHNCHGCLTWHDLPGNIYHVICLILCPMWLVSYLFFPTPILPFVYCLLLTTAVSQLLKHCNNLGFSCFCPYFCPTPISIKNYLVLPYMDQNPWKCMFWIRPPITCSLHRILWLFGVGIDPS